MFASTSDWFIRLFVSVVIGKSDYFGFGLRHSSENRSITFANKEHHANINVQSCSYSFNSHPNFVNKHVYKMSRLCQF